MKTLFQKMRDNRQMAEECRRQLAKRPSTVEQTITAAIERMNDKIVREKEMSRQQRWYRASAWFNKGGAS